MSTPAPAEELADEAAERFHDVLGTAMQVWAHREYYTTVETPIEFRLGRRAGNAVAMNASDDPPRRGEEFVGTIDAIYGGTPGEDGFPATVVIEVDVVGSTYNITADREHFSEEEGVVTAMRTASTVSLDEHHVAHIAVGEEVDDD